ncbi:MAG: hypothetical protein K0S76_1566 [Herbinix sp.]|nr:hypothetical protein [Herbinix sp.]
MDYDKYYFHNVDISIPFYGMTMIINYIFFAQENPNFWHTPTHCHAGYELHYISQGRGVLKAGDERYVLCSGSLFLIGPGIYHEIISDEKDAMAQHCISFDIEFNSIHNKKAKEFLILEYEKLQELWRKLEFYYGVDQTNCGQHFAVLHKEFITPRIGFYTFVGNTISNLFIEFIRSCTNNKEAQYQIPRKTSDDIRKVLIDEAFNENYVSLTKKQLAELLHISIRQLERNINQYYSMSFNEKLTCSRIEQAKAMLVSTGLTVEKIAEDTGFPNSGSFTTAFKRLTNATPGNYRKTFRSN